MSKTLDENVGYSKLGKEFIHLTNMLLKKRSHFGVSKNLMLVECSQSYHEEITTKK